MDIWSNDPLPKAELGKILVVRRQQQKGYMYLYYEPSDTERWFNQHTGYYKEGDKIEPNLVHPELTRDWQIAEFKL